MQCSVPKLPGTVNFNIAEDGVAEVIGADACDKTGFSNKTNGVGLLLVENLLMSSHLIGQIGT